MGNTAKVIHLQIKPTRSAPMQSVGTVEAIAEQGLRNELSPEVPFFDCDVKINIQYINCRIIVYNTFNIKAVLRVTKVTTKLVTDKKLTSHPHAPDILRRSNFMVYDVCSAA